MNRLNTFFKESIQSQKFDFDLKSLKISAKVYLTIVINLIDSFIKERIQSQKFDFDVKSLKI